MKLSNETLTILKNFSSINAGILFKQGKTLSTVSSTKTVLAQCTLQEEFPQEFAIHDLTNFLSVLSLSKDTPELDFDDQHIIIKALGGRSKIKYRFADKKMIITPPDKAVVMPSEDVSFTLNESDYDWITRTANVLNSPHVAIEGKNGKLRISSFDAKDDAANINSVDIDDTDKAFKSVFKTENLKMIPGSYDVTVSSKGIAHFKNKNVAIEYWIAIEKDASNFEG
jgi:hypothetical protein